MSEPFAGLAVAVPVELAPAISKLLRLGVRAARADGYLVPAAVQEAVETITAVGQHQALSVLGRVSGVSGGSTDMEGRLPSDELDTETVAGMLHCSTRNVCRLADDETLDGRRIGRRWLIRRSSVDAYLAGH